MPTPAPVELSLPPDAAVERVVRRLGRSVTVHAGPTRCSDRVLLDTFDGRLRSRSWTAWKEQRADRDGSVVLSVERPAEPPMSAPAAPARRDRILLQELGSASARGRLEPVIEERALLPLVRVRTAIQPLQVCNQDAKTVVRVLVEEPRVVGPDGEIALTPRLRVVPVLGYDRDFARVSALLQKGARLVPVGESLADEAMRAAGLAPGGVSSEVKVPLERAMPAGEAMMAVCRRLAEIVEANLPGTLDDLDPEFLHDLRVGVRRTRSVLKEMKGVLEPGTRERAASDLRWMQEITGPTRDLDVLLRDWPSMASPVPPAMAADLAPLQDLLLRHRRAAFEAMRRNLRSRRFAEAWETWRSLIDDPGAAAGPDAAVPAGELAGRRIVAVYRAMVKMGGAIDDHSPPPMLHDLRKRGKELRYLLELFGGMWPAGKVKPLVNALKGLQDVLGHFQDDEIQVAELRRLGPELAAAPGGTDSLIALGFVLDGLNASQSRARDAYAARFADFTRPATRDVIHDTFRPATRARRGGGQQP